MESDGEDLGIVDHLQLSMASDPDTSVAQATDLARHRHWMVRAAVAARPDLTEDLFLVLAQDSNRMVRESVRRNVFCTDEARAAAALMNL